MDKDNSLNVIKNSQLWFGFSGVLIFASLIFIFLSIIKFSSPVRPGLDFTGGTKLEYSFANSELEGKDLSSETIQKLLVNYGLKNSKVQVAPGEERTQLIIRTKAISDDPVLEKFNTDLTEDYAAYNVESIDTVSPVIGPELFTSGLTALIVTIIGIIVYISTRFQRDYAFAAITALFHDVFIVLGLFAFLGLFFDLEVNSLFITALLTIFGFSVHDTIVVFDRIRENQRLQSKTFTFNDVAETSINQVFQRSLNTSITTLTVLGFLFFFGGLSTKLFVGAMFVGMLVGTYSSIFVASPVLVLFRTFKKA
ncbi:MAG: protein translocase subunit SecF [Candidatus Caenarcaniphilales bacterium]|nr:protein translocase subunit SecF [Candidatus Caenarcaniphilales bacterium]